MKVSAHVMVKNEYRFLWYSVMSIIDHVDRVLLWDTGSTDGTIEIIQEIVKAPESKGKVYFKNHLVDPFDEQLVRQQMLDSDTSEWFLVVDGDEIWWESSIRQVTDAIKEIGDSYESIVIPTINTVGDIFHHQEKQAGNYRLAGRVGHYNLRGVNRAIPGLHSEGVHGVWGWADENNMQVQERDPKKILFIDAPYLHCTFLERAFHRSFDSGVEKRTQKLKHEIGIPFPSDYYYPEVFFRPKPSIVPSVWKEMDTAFYRRALLETPARKMKRRLLPKKVGY